MTLVKLLQIGYMSNDANISKIGSEIENSQLV